MNGGIEKIINIVVYIISLGFKIIRMKLIIIFNVAGHYYKINHLMLETLGVETQRSITEAPPSEDVVSIMT